MYKIDNKTKKQRLKIQSRGWIFKNTILKKRSRRKKEKRKKATRIIKKLQQQPHKDYIWCLP